VRLYWEIARRGYRRYAAYPAATVAGAFTNTVFGFMRGYILLALFAHQAQIGGYDAQDTITYVWLTQAFIGIVGIFGWNDVALRIRSGDIATDLVRPLHPFVWGYAFDLGRAFYQGIFRGLPPLAVGALVFDLTAPSSPLVLVAFLTSTLLAVSVSFAWRFLYNTAAFWLTDYRGTMLLAVIITSVFSGFVIPIHFFPGWLEAVARATPFPAMLQTPVDVFVGRTSGTEIVTALAVQAAWAAVLVAASLATFAAGARKLVIQGG
jgi:ABC-2 type transport system permease protein